MSFRDTFILYDYDILKNEVFHPTKLQHFPHSTKYFPYFFILNQYLMIRISHSDAKYNDTNYNRCSFSEGHFLIYTIPFEQHNLFFGC